MTLDPETAIGAVTLKVADLEAMADFYRQVIGLRELNRSRDRMEMGTDVRTWVVLQDLAGGRRVSHAPGLYHMALRLPSRQALAHWFRHYVDIGTPHWQGASDHGVSEALYLTDPEGNGIEIYCDRPQEAWPVASEGGYAMGSWALDVQALRRESPTAEWRGMPDTMAMGHVHLKVADLDTARAFYVDRLGFEVKAAMGGSALFVAAGRYHHHIGLNTWESRGAEPAPENAYGLAHFAIVYPTSAARDAVLARLAAADDPVTAAEGAAPQVDDPSGNTIILTVAASETTGAA